MKWQSYRNEGTKAQPPRPFSQQEALDSIRRTQSELDQGGPWPEHLTGWLKENHLAALQAIKRATNGIDHACLNQNVTGLEKALVEYKRAWQEGLNLWRDT
jgi:hypothetical protein